MEITDPVAEVKSIFDQLRSVIGKFAVSEDADHRTAGKSKKALDLCKTELRDLTLITEEHSAQVHAVLERITSELAAITNGTSPSPPHKGKIADMSPPRAHGQTDNIVANISGDWVKVAKGGKKAATQAVVSKTLSEIRYENVHIIPNGSYPPRKCISIHNREEVFNHLGRICVLPNGLMLVGIEDYIIPLWIPELQEDTKAYKVLDHNTPRSVPSPDRSTFFVDPTINPLSRDTGNFLLQTHIWPISGPQGGTSYAVRVGGLKTIASDLVMCDATQLSYARRYHLRGLMTALMIIDVERKMGQSTGKK